MTARMLLAAAAALILTAGSVAAMDGNGARKGRGPGFRGGQKKAKIVPERKKNAMKEALKARRGGKARPEAGKARHARPQMRCQCRQRLLERGPGKARMMRGRAPAMRGSSAPARRAGRSGMQGARGNGWFGNLDRFFHSRRGAAGRMERMRQGPGRFMGGDARRTGQARMKQGDGRKAVEEFLKNRRRNMERRAGGR